MSASDEALTNMLDVGVNAAADQLVVDEDPLDIDVDESADLHPGTLNRL